MELKDKKLEHIVDVLTVALKERLAQKEAEGFSGWDDTKAFPDRECWMRALIRVANINVDGALDPIEKDSLDAIAFLMFLWECTEPKACEQMTLADKYVRVRNALERLVGASSLEELKAMESSIWRLPIPANEYPNIIAAIQTLIAVR